MSAERLEGSDRTLRSDATILGRVSRQRVVRLTLQVRSSQDPEGQLLRSFTLDTTGNRVSQRTHLTREQYASRFGATRTDFQRAKQFARSYGLRVLQDDVVRRTGASSLGHRTIELAGSASAIKRAFGVEMLRAVDGQGRKYRTYQGVLRIPSEYSGVIQNVFGLDSRPQAAPRFHLRRGLGGYSLGTTTDGFSPDQVGRLYKFPGDFNGKGETIALIELGGGFRRRDLRRFFTGLGIRQPSVHAVSVAGGRNKPSSPDSADGEVMLDLEVVGAVAPGAKAVVYFAPNTNRGFLRAVNAAIHDSVHQPSIISISWGGPESTWSLLDMQSLDEAFQAAAAIGISVFAAAGDDGSTDGVGGTTPHVDFPGSSPFVTACGGTRLVVAADQSVTETVWNDGPGSGTGGGISAVFPRPVYQTGPGISIPPSLDPTVGAGRGVPDVSGNADPATGYTVRVDAVDMVIGGTSAVAPLWAGLFACFNEALGHSVGFANTLLYSVVAATPGALRDIVSGNNDTTGTLGGYAATPGWDPCTGLGTPADAGQILNALRTT